MLLNAWPELYSPLQQCVKQWVEHVGERYHHALGHGTKPV
jgi:hypothetical protein